MPTFNSLKVSKKLAVAFGILVAINLCASATVLFNLQSVDTAIEHSDRADALMEMIDHTVNTQTNAELSIRDLMLSGDIGYIDKFKKYAGEAEAFLSKINASDALKTSEFRSAVASADAIRRRWLDTFAATQLAYILRPETVDLARATETSPERIAITAELGDTFSRIDEIVATLVSEARARQAKLLEWSFIILITASVGMVGSALAIIWLINRTVAKPIGTLATITQRLAEKDWSVEISDTPRSDEVGVMAKAVAYFKDSLIKNEEMNRAALEEEQRRAARAEQLRTIASEFDGYVREHLETVTGSAKDMRATAESLSETAEQNSCQASSVAGAARQAAGNVQTVAAAAEELGSSIQEISRQVQEQAVKAQSASTATERSRKRVEGL